MLYPTLRKQGQTQTIAGLHLRLTLPALVALWVLGMGLAGLAELKMSEFWLAASVALWVVLVAVSWFLIRPALTDPGPAATSKLMAGTGITHLGLVIGLVLMIWRPDLLMDGTIRAAVSRAFGEPLSIEEVVLDGPDEGEVRVRLGAVAICHSDVSYADGEWGGTLPAVWGHEAAGVITAVGDKVGFETGQRVVVTLIRSCGECLRCQRGAEIACRADFPLNDRTPIRDMAGHPITHGMGTGAFAEEVVVHASQVVPIDDDIPIGAASLLACGVITGVGAVFNTARVDAAEHRRRARVRRASASTSSRAQPWRRRPTIVAVDPQSAKLDLAIRLGATHAHEPEAGTGLADLVADLTDGRMADYVFVSTGAPSALAGADALVGTMGAIVIVGMPASGVTGVFDPGSLAGRNQRILGSKMGTSVIARDIPALLTRYHAGELELDGLISHTFQLDEINTAMDEVRTGSALRNVVVFDPEI